MNRQLTSDQIDALRFYSEIFGRRWKQVLRSELVADRCDNLALKALKASQGVQFLDTYRLPAA